MNTIVMLSIFKNQADFDTATHALQANGVEAKDISVLMIEHQTSHSDTVMDSTAGGATTGGLVGGLAGLLIGIGAVVVPGIGAVLVGGPLVTALGLTGLAATAATTVTGGVTGALTGGLVGGLVGLGLSDVDARLYENNIKEGSILLGLKTNDLQEETFRKILTTNFGKDIKTIIVDKQEALQN